jgi:hypothetical protein
MRNGLGVFDPEQLRALQTIFDETWLRATGSNLAPVTDWQVLRNEIAQKVMDYAQRGWTDDEIARTILTTLGLL